MQYPSEVGGPLHFPNRLHEGVSSHAGDVGPREAISPQSQAGEVHFSQAVKHTPKLLLKYQCSAVLVRHGDTHASLKAKAHGERTSYTHARIYTYTHTHTIAFSS